MGENNANHLYDREFNIPNIWKIHKAQQQKSKNQINIWIEGLNFSKEEI